MIIDLTNGPIGQPHTLEPAPDLSHFGGHMQSLSGLIAGTGWPPLRLLTDGNITRPADFASAILLLVFSMTGDVAELPTKQQLDSGVVHFKKLELTWDAERGRMMVTGAAE